MIEKEDTHEKHTILQSALVIRHHCSVVYKSRKYIGADSVFCRNYTQEIKGGTNNGRNYELTQRH